MERPRLIEPGMKYFINETLKNCHTIKTSYNNFLYNTVAFILFFLVLAIFLIIRYKGKLTPIEKEVKLRQQKTYILSKIKKMQDIKKQTMQTSNMITDLPKLTDDFDYYNTKKIFT
jgi:large-conductance mechanosensitive channel